jgi:hypothetical protein
VLRNRRLIAVVCVVVLFAVAMAPLTSHSGASLCAVLVPLPILFGAVPSAPLPASEPVLLPSSFSTPPLPSRAPPLA